MLSRIGGEWWVVVMVCTLILLVAVAILVGAEPPQLSVDQAVMWDLKVLLQREPTNQELAKYLADYPGARDLAQETIKLDWIEHQAPQVAVPGFIAILTGRNLVWGWDGPLQAILPAPTAGAPPVIQWNVTLKGGEAKDFAPAEHSVRDILLWAGVALVVGGVTGYLLHP